MAYDRVHDGGRECEAIVLDLDGTLLDTEPCYEAAFHAAARNFGIVVPPDLYAELVGLATGDRVGALRRAFGARFPVNDFISAYYRLRAAFLPARIPLCAGATALLRNLHMPMAIATSASRRTALAHIRRAGLGDVFAHVVTRDDVCRTKPSPDAFLRAAALLNVPSSSCVAIEDSAHGVAAAHAAGMRVVLVGERPGPGTGSFVRVRNLDAVVRLLGGPVPRPEPRATFEHSPSRRAEERFGGAHPDPRSEEHPPGYRTNERSVRLRTDARVPEDRAGEYSADHHAKQAAG